MRMVVFILALSMGGTWLPPIRGEVVVTVLPEPEVFFSGFFPVGGIYPVNLDGDSLVDFTFDYSVSNVGLRTERANRLVFRISPPPNLGGPVQRLEEGFLIGPELDTPGIDWRSGDLRDGYVSPEDSGFVSIVLCFNTGCSTTWPKGLGMAQQGFIGVEFEMESGKHYGYFDVEVSGDGPSALLYGWAYETRPGVPIRAGARAGEGLLALEKPRVANSNLWLTISGQLGTEVVLERSPDLTSWTPVLTNTSPFQTVFPVTTNETRGFFRVVEVE